MESRLKNNAFIAGQQFSVADITALVTVDFATKALQIAVAETSASTRSWYDMVNNRAAAAA